MAPMLVYPQIMTCKFSTSSRTFPRQSSMHPAALSNKRQVPFLSLAACPSWGACIHPLQDFSCVNHPTMSPWSQWGHLPVAVRSLTVPSVFSPCCCSGLGVSERYLSILIPQYRLGMVLEYAVWLWGKLSGKQQNNKKPKTKPNHQQKKTTKKNPNTPLQQNQNKTGKEEWQVGQNFYFFLAGIRQHTLCENYTRQINQSFSPCV